MTSSFILFVVLVTGGLYVTRGDGAQTLKGAAWRTLVFVGIAMVYGANLWRFQSPEAAEAFFAGYAMEKALSVDNLMVFSLVFAHFTLKEELRPQALRYGLVGAVVSRLVLTAAGCGGLFVFGRLAEVVFGLLVGWSAYKVLTAGADGAEFSLGGWLAKRLPPSSIFWLCVLAIESTDVMFSFDSVPAVIAVARDPFIVYPAMIFAILGLRSLYFVLEALKKYLTHLDKAVIAILAVVSVKLVTGLHISAAVNLILIVIVLAAGVAASLLDKTTSPSPKTP